MQWWYVWKDDASHSWDEWCRCRSAEAGAWSNYPVSPWPEQPEPQPSPTIVISPTPRSASSETWSLIIPRYYVESGIRLKRSVSFCNLLWVISLLCVRPPLAGPSVSLIQCWQCSGLISGNTRGINSDTRQGDARQPSSGIRAGWRLQLQTKVCEDFRNRCEIGMPYAMQRS